MAVGAEDATMGHRLRAMIEDLEAFLSCQQLEEREVRSTGKEG